MTSRLVKLLLTALCVISLIGCAATSARRAGETAEQQEDFDRAVLEYTRALRAAPQDRQAQRALQRAKLRAAEQHFTRGRRLASLGKYEEALLEYQVAAELNPTGGEIEDQLRATRLKLRAKLAVLREGKTELESLVDRMRQAPLPGLELPADIKLPDSLVFRQASSRDIFSALAKLADVSLTFDPAFRETPLTIDLRGSSFADALTAVASSTKNFYRVTAPRTLTIIPDTAAKRREYEEAVVKTFFLSNADLKETLDLLRIVVDARQVASTVANNAITIKDTPERVAAAGRVISAIDKARPEVVIDVELMEVDRVKLREYGLQLASPASPLIGISGTADVNRDKFTLRDLSHLSSSEVFLTGVPALFYRALKSDTSTRLLANPHLRTSEGLAAQARFGERIPVPTTTFSPIATGGVPQQPITAFTYEDIGVNIDITPRIHHDDDVSLALRVSVSSQTGSGFGGLPVFGNRSVTTVIRLRDGETNMLAGLIRDDERRSLDGVPGLSDIPVVGRLFARNRREAQETDIVLTLTPHIIRVLDLSENDLAAFRFGRETRPGLGDLPGFELPPFPIEPQPKPPVKPPDKPPDKPPY